MRGIRTSVTLNPKRRFEVSDSIFEATDILNGPGSVSTDCAVSARELLAWEGFKHL
jgi:hypothetical protein